MKPAGYPLPWCEALDLAYWQINIWLCGNMQGWRERQSHKDMKEIMPWIDELIAGGAILRATSAPAT